MVNRRRNDRDRSSKRGFTYTPRDPKKVKERSEKTGQQFDSIFISGVDSWRPKVGDNAIRILPPTWEDAEHYGLDVWVHPRVGADSSTYLCLNKMKGKHCPICEAAKEAKDAGEDDEAKALQPKQQYIAYIIDRDGDSDLPQVWQMSWTMDRDIAALCVNKKTGKVLQIDHPDEGYDINFKRVGQGLNTRYVGLQVERDQSPIDDKQKKQDEILDIIAEKPLPTLLKFYDAEHLQKVIDGTAGSKDDDDEDDEKPRNRRRGRDDDDDEEDAKPSRRGRGSKDADDDEEEEEEEEEKPSSRRERVRTRR